MRRVHPEELNTDTELEDEVMMAPLNPSKTLADNKTGSHVAKKVSAC